MQLIEISVYNFKFTSFFIFICVHLYILHNCKHYTYGVLFQVNIILYIIYTTVYLHMCHFL